MCAVAPAYVASLITEFYDPNLHHSRGVAPSGFAIEKDSLLLPPVGVWTVSLIPVWPITLSGRLCIVALVSRYLTN